ncbi:MAG: nucleotidyltransferase family protein [Thermodesulfobacteriota bacterium]
MDGKSDQITKIKERLAGVLERNGVKKAALFGSIARGEATGESDIDLLVEFEGRKSLLDLSGLKLDVEDALGRKADVLTYGSLHPLLRDRILEEQVVIL